MNKNLIKSLLVCLIACFSMEISAQITGVRYNNAPKPVYGIEAGANQAWWGYFNGDAENLWTVGYGEDQSTTGCLYNAAIFVPGTELTNSKSIKAVRILLRNVTNMSDFYVWASTSLPEVPEEADYFQKIAKSQLTDAISGSIVNDIMLDNPVNITEEGLYVGYSFRMNAFDGIDDFYPVLYQKDSKIQQGRMFVRWYTGEWVDLSTDKNFGNLAMNVLLEGEFEQNSLAASPEFDFTVGVKGMESIIKVDVEKTGVANVDNISYELSINGQTSGESTYTLTEPMKNIGEKRTISLPVIMNGELGFGDGVLTITKVNGEENKAASNKVNGKTAIVSKKVPSNVLYEEYCTVSSGYYPMAIVAKKNIKERYGAEAICVSNHRYDKMSNAEIAEAVRNYKQKNWYEKCDLNRTFMNADPYYGTTPSDIRVGAVPSTCTVLDDLDYLHNQLPLAEVKVNGSYDEETSIITVNGEYTFLCDINDAAYNVLYYVLEDGMTGTGTGWDMENFLSGVDGLENYDPLFEEFVSAPEGKMTEVEFNDVAIAAKGFPYGLENVIGSSVQNDATIQHTVTIDVNELVADVKNVVIQDFDKLKLVAVLLDKNTGRVVNAAQCSLSSELGIDGVTTSDESKEAVAFYAPDGTVRNHEVKGLNIVKYSDGSVKKVIIK